MLKERNFTCKSQCWCEEKVGRGYVCLLTTPISSSCPDRKITKIFSLLPRESETSYFFLSTSHG